MSILSVVFECARAGGVRLAVSPEALTSWETATVHGASMPYGDLKRIVVDLGRIQGRSWNTSILNHPCVSAPIIRCAKDRWRYWCNAAYQSSVVSTAAVQH